MNIKNPKRTATAVVLGVLAVGGGVFVGTRIAQADGVPQTQPLTYAGTLLDALGNPATGNVNLDLNLHTTATGGSPVCTTSGSFMLTNTKGRFQMVLDPACTMAVHATPDLYVDLKVNGLSIFTTRPKLGAVPYALEADTARVARRGLYENPTTMNESSEGGGFCGVTAQTFAGAAVGGYTGAKTKCQTACATSTAHICSSDEMVRYASTGGTHGQGSGWIATGVPSTSPGVSGGSANAEYVTDCKGFTTSQPNGVAGANNGAAWIWTVSAPAGNAGVVGCDSAQPIACCD